MSGRWAFNGIPSFSLMMVDGGFYCGGNLGRGVIARGEELKVGWVARMRVGCWAMKVGARDLV